MDKSFDVLILTQMIEKLCKENHITVKEMLLKSNLNRNVVDNLKKERVNMVLMHDIKPYTRDALRNIIKYGKSNGYRFEKITMDTEMITQRVNN